MPGYNVRLRLDDAIYERLQELASLYGLRPVELVKLWIGQQLHEEDRRREQRLQTPTKDVNITRA